MFNVGDIICGNQEPDWFGKPYSSKGTVLEVVHVYTNGSFDGKLLDSPCQDWIGKVGEVLSADRFTLKTPLDPAIKLKKYMKRVEERHLKKVGA